MCIHSTLLHLPALAIAKMETQKTSVLVVVSPIISSTSTESLGLRGLTEKKDNPSWFSQFWCPLHIMHSLPGP